MGWFSLTLVILMIFDLFTGFGRHPMWIALGLLLYGCYLIIDIHSLVSGGRSGIGFDDYIPGAMLIYLDIIMIFIKILQLVGKRKN